jgi:hypothetical protein
MANVQANTMKYASTVGDVMAVVSTRQGSVKAAGANTGRSDFVAGTVDQRVYQILYISIGIPDSGR